MASRNIAAPPGFTDEYLEWALSQPRLFNDPDPEPPTEQQVDRNETESNRTESEEAESNKTGSNKTASNEAESNETEFGQSVIPLFGPPGTPCHFYWDRFQSPLSEWQEGLEAIYAPFSDEAWSVCTTEEWLYGVLHARLVTRFERQPIGPTEQEEREIHVICMLAKYYLIKREEMGQAHLPIYVEEALSDAIIKLTRDDVDFTE